jgi:hypothetical protein
VLPVGHFFLVEQSARVIGIVAEKLAGGGAGAADRRDDHAGHRP